jgi:CheY-like chemotaxis protein
MPDALSYHEPLDGSWRRFEKDNSQTPDQGPNLGLVLVVGLSPVNRVVVGRIVERGGLKVLCETPQNARRSLVACRPGMVIVDCGCDNSDCDDFAPVFQQFRLGQGGGLPLLIMVSTSGTATGGTLLAELADAVVSKPVTVDGLQPVMLQLIESARR